MVWHQLFADYERFVLVPAGPDRMPLLNQVFRGTAEFLSKTEHKRKFHHPEFVKVLHDSAKSAKAFSAQDAEDCFRAMERIARNLYLQPWRSEQYRSIKKWAQLFKCRIEPCLVDATRIFKLIGYDEKADELVLSDQAAEVKASRKLLEVAFDCFVASVECRLLDSVRKLVVNGENLPWAKILKARETIVGDVQKCAAKIDPKSIDHPSPTVLFSVDGTERKESLLLPELQAPSSWDDLSSIHIDSTQDPWSLVPSPRSLQAGTLISVPVQGGLRRTTDSSTASHPPPVPPHQPLAHPGVYSIKRNVDQPMTPLPGFERIVPNQKVHGGTTSAHVQGRANTLPRGLSGERVISVQIEPSYSSVKVGEHRSSSSSSSPHGTVERIRTIPVHRIDGPTQNSAIPPTNSSQNALQLFSPETDISLRHLNDQMYQMTMNLKAAREKAHQTLSRTGDLECRHCQMLISSTVIICPHCNRMV